MASHIVYLISVNPRLFAAALADPVDWTEIGRARAAGELWSTDARFSGSDLWFDTDLTGIETVSHLWLRHSALVAGGPPDVIGRIRAWEQSLRRHLPEAPVLRMSSDLFEEWNEGREWDCTLSRDAAGLAAFRGWLLTQDAASWVRLG